MTESDITSAPDQPARGTATGQVHSEFEDKFSDYYEDALPADERARVAAHLEDCAACRAAYDELRSAVTALSGLHKMKAPPAFESQVEDTIRRRSDGRFFGRKAFGDRVPFEILAIVALLLGLAVFALLRSSSTGSLRYEKDTKAPDIAPGARQAVPQPAPPGSPSP